MVIAGHNFIVYVVSPKKSHNQWSALYSLCWIVAWYNVLISSYTEAGSGFVLSQPI